MPLLPLLFAAPAFAQSEDDTRVFVSEFQAVNKEAGSLAALLGGYLYSELEQHPQLDAVPVQEAPDFGDNSAMVYLLSCPPGEYVGCAYVVADRVDAEYAVAGTVEALPEGTVVHVTIIDVWESREAVTFDIQLEVGEDELFARKVAEMMVAVVEGEAGQLEDIRDGEPVDEDDPEAAARQLEALAMEMGGVTAISTRSDRSIQRPEYTLDDLSQDAATDAIHPWDALGMTPDEYMQYKNSGLTVQEWKKVAAGRRGQVVIRLEGGLARGPFDTSYRAWYAIDGSTLDTVQSQAWQARETTSTYQAGVWLGYGLTPSLEVGAGFATLGGRYTMHIQQEIVDEDVTPRAGEDFNAPNYALQAQALGSLFPTRPFRPLVGGRISYVLGEATDDNAIPPAGLPAFSGANLMIVSGLVGAEVSLHPALDLYAVVPVGVVVLGGEALTWEEGQPGFVQSYVEPGSTPLLSTGVQVGFSVRLFGRYETVERDLEEEF